MILWDDFEDAVVNKLNRDIRSSSNRAQNSAVRAPLGDSLFIVAGPGSGKTTVIVLRVLKLILVDDIDPSNILVTTFTRKAAAELGSRMLGWGDQLRQAFMDHPLYLSLGNQLRGLDFNRIITGTLDSISEELLRDSRAPGTPPPIVVEDFVCNALMTTVGLFNQGRHNSQDLKDFILKVRADSWGLNISEMSATLRAMADRLNHDGVRVNPLRAGHGHPGVSVACDAIDDYDQELQRRLLFDFARLEQESLTNLRTPGRLDDFLRSIKFVLVDEYQDTNLLQEQIYLQMAGAAAGNGGSITVVGDDDQSLYRFRGATVDLFQAFQYRINNQLTINPATVYLSRNYRSTPAIVAFVNDFATMDAEFQNARVPAKPQIIASRTSTPQPFVNYPVLGMFREDVETLAHDLSLHLHSVIYGAGVQITHRGQSYTMRINPQGGTAGDIAVLCSSPQELDYRGDPRFPGLLRRELSQVSPPIQVFNPRGQKLERVPEVQRLCGLILECIDPGSGIQGGIRRLPAVAASMLNEWRAEAQSFLGGNPSPAAPISLAEFADAWRSRVPLRRTLQAREDVSLVDLVYKLITWIATMQNDPEGLVYLEAVTRTLSQSALFSDFNAQVIFDPTSPGSSLERASIKEAIWNIFVPLATGAIDINEDLLETLPSDRVNIMSIHQAKGLEFPMVIVDVGSDFRSRHWKQAFKRFPLLDNNGRVRRVASVNMEDELRPFSPLGAPQRSGFDRAFDDLIRQYFVAFSRAQDVLLLVGLASVRDGVLLTRGSRQDIPNVATGWDRNEHWLWGRGLPNMVHI